MQPSGAARRTRAKAVTVVVVRHGESELRNPVRWPNDDLRPLTRTGRSRTKQAVRGLARIVPSVDRLATSAATRATLTAEMVRGALHGPPAIETWPELAPGNFAGPLFDKVRRRTQGGKRDVLLVGHSPTLAEFVGMALTGDDLKVVDLTKAGAACLEFPAQVKPGAGRLRWLLTRKQLTDRKG